MSKGLKTCNSCGKPNGCRTKTCECGFEFGTEKTKQGKGGVTTRSVKQTKHPLGMKYVPVPGLWVFDKKKDMPSIHAPSELPSGPVDNQGVYDQCTYNGLGDCIFEYIPARRIADPKLRKLWKKAHDAMREAWRYLINEQESTDAAAEKKGEGKHRRKTPTTTATPTKTTPLSC